MATIPEIKGWFDGWEAELAKIAPAGFNIARALRNALTLIQDPRTPTLRDCTQRSMFVCLMRCIELGLQPNGRHAHLIPRKDRRANTTNCTLMIDYKGLVDLAMRSGLLSRPSLPRLVYERDQFTVHQGTNEEIIHAPYVGMDEPGSVTHAYIVFWFRSGAFTFESMTRQQIEHVRGSGYKTREPDSVWSKHWEEMARKTVTKRCLKHLQLSADLNEALICDDAAELGRPPGDAVAVGRRVQTDTEIEQELTGEAETENGNGTEAGPLGGGGGRGDPRHQGLESGDDPTDATRATLARADAGADGTAPGVPESDGRPG